MSEELKPCQCGEGVEIQVNTFLSYDYIRCLCGMWCCQPDVTPSTRARLIEVWNTRHDDKSQNVKEALGEIDNQFELLELSKQGYDTVSKETIEASLSKIKTLLEGGRGE